MARRASDEDIARLLALIAKAGPTLTRGEVMGLHRFVRTKHATPTVVQYLIREAEAMLERKAKREAFAAFQPAPADTRSARANIKQGELFPQTTEQRRLQDGH